MKVATTRHDHTEVEWSNIWGKGERLSSGLIQGLILLLFGSLVLSYGSFGGSKSCNRLSFISLLSSSFLFPFSPPSLPPFFSLFLSVVLGGPLMLYTSFSLILAIHLLIMQVATWVSVSSVAFFNLLWVVANKVILFRSHFLINAAKLSATGI